MSPEMSPEMEMLRLQLEQLSADADQQAQNLKRLNRLFELVMSAPTRRADDDPEAPVAPTRAHPAALPAPPEFLPGAAVESHLVEWVSKSGRDWKAKDLIAYLARYSNLADTGYDVSNIYQALSRAARQGRLYKGAYGVYGPPR